MTGLQTASTRTLDEALALRPDLRAGYRALEAALAAEPALDPARRARCRARIAGLVGADTSDGGEASTPSPDDVVLEFVEQFVIDPHGVSDALVARLAAILSPRGVVALAQAVAVWEGQYRLARALGVAVDA